MPMHDRLPTRLHSHDGVSSASRSSRSRSPNLQLGPLPRFHPANFPSAAPSISTSAVTSPTSSVTSPPTPGSPRLQHQHLSSNLFHGHRPQPSGPQRQLIAHQRDIVNSNRFYASQSGPRSPSRSYTSIPHFNPASPRLDPAPGSPGPMTPFELEEHNEYQWGSPKQFNDEGKGQGGDVLSKKNDARPTSPIMIDRLGARSPRLIAATRSADITRHRSHLSR